MAGSMGDFGTLFPLAIGFIAVNGMDPASLFIVMGLANIALSLIHRLPMPLEPKKVVAVTAIAPKWPPSLIYNSAFGLGLVWFLLVFTGVLRKIVSITPLFLVRGIQIALAVKLRGWKLALAATTAAMSVVMNVAVGFVVGLGVTHLLRALGRRENLPGKLSGILPEEESLFDD